MRKIIVFLKPQQSFTGKRKTGLISASLVTYHNPKDEVKSVIDTFLNSSLESILFVVDNSSDSMLQEICSNERIVYIYNEANLGFGTGHNIAIKRAISMDIKFHFILNPDVKYDPGVIEILVSKMNSDPSIGAIMPKVLNIDHSIQYLPKLLPSPFLLLVRTIRPFRWLFKKQYGKYVLAKYEDIELSVPTLSGCFSLYSLDALKEVGLFNEKFFMYFEDTDLSRRVHKSYKTIYFPSVTILHVHTRGAAKEFSLFKIFAKSAITYFNKYGWFFDKERRSINREVLQQLSEIKSH